MKLKLLLSFICLGSIGSIYSMDENPDQMLIRGAQEGNIKLVQKALDEYADVNHQPDLINETALIEAASKGYATIVKLLLDNEADTDIQSNCGYTALIHATINKNEAIVKLLLDANANYDIKDWKGDTALNWAVARGNITIAKLLLYAGASFDLEISNFRYAEMVANETQAMVELIKQEPKRRRQKLHKEFVESCCLLPELADIILEYTEYSKEKCLV